MEIKKADVKNIFIWSRGKNRDIYGNPYYAYVCRINMAAGRKSARVDIYSVDSVDDTGNKTHLLRIN